MGIQINGQTDTVTSTTSGGSVKVTPAVINATGVSTFSGGINVGTGASISSPTTNVLTLGTNNVESVRVSSGGVSIGTVTTYGDSNASFTSLSLGGNGTRYGLLELKQSNSVAGAWIDCYGTLGNGDLRITTAGTSNNITFWTGGAFTEKVRITSGGNVGIGTTNPSQKLEVVGGEIKAGRVDTGSEGGQVSFGRASDNATGWYIDVYGSTSMPDLRFVDVSNGVVRKTIDGSGRVLMPYQPAFKAYGGTFTTGSVVVFTSTSVNVGGHYSTSNGRFTAPVTGNYVISAQIFVSATGTTQINIRKNNSTGPLELKVNTNEGAYNSASASFVIALTAGDYITVFADSGSVLMGEPYTWFSGYLIG